jgi:hypothetical protein
VAASVSISGKANFIFSSIHLFSELGPPWLARKKALGRAGAGPQPGETF